MKAPAETAQTAGPRCHRCGRRLPVLAVRRGDGCCSTECCKDAHGISFRGMEKAQ